MPSLQQCSERELLGHILAKDQDSKRATDVLFSRYRGRAILAAERWGAGLDADDVAQCALISAWIALPTYDPAIGKFGAWFYRILRNEFLQYCREKSKTPAHIPLEYLNGAHPHEDAAPFVELTGWEFWAILRPVLDSLPECMQEAVHLRIIESETYQGIADQMDVSYDTAYQNVRDGLKKVRQELSCYPEIVEALDVIAKRKGKGKERELLGQYA